MTDAYEEPAALPCAEKLVYDTQREANAAAVYVHHIHGTRLRSYQCRYCGLWHLTGQPA